MFWTLFSLAKQTAEGHVNPENPDWVQLRLVDPMIAEWVKLEYKKLAQALGKPRGGCAMSEWHSPTAPTPVVCASCRALTAH